MRSLGVSQTYLNSSPVHTLCCHHSLCRRELSMPTDPCGNSCSFYTHVTRSLTQSHLLSLWGPYYQKTITTPEFLPYTVNSRSFSTFPGVLALVWSVRAHIPTARMCTALSLLYTGHSALVYFQCAILTLAS